METERTSNLWFFVVVGVNFEKKVAVLFIRTLFWSPAGLELMENNKWRFKSLITASWTVVLWRTAIARRRTNVHRNKFLPGSPQSFQICPQELGLFLLNVLRFNFNVNSPIYTLSKR